MEPLDEPGIPIPEQAANARVTVVTMQARSID
jgi:hypothetical protein